MAKFAIGDKVDKAADDHHEAGTVIAVFSTTDGQRTAIFATRSTWKATARSSSSSRKIWSFTLTDSPTGTELAGVSCPNRR